MNVMCYDNDCGTKFKINSAGLFVCRRGGALLALALHGVANAHCARPSLRAKSEAAQRATVMEGLNADGGAHFYLDGRAAVARDAFGLLHDTYSQYEETLAEVYHVIKINAC